MYIGRDDPVSEHQDEASRVVYQDRQILGRHRGRQVTEHFTENRIVNGGRALGDPCESFEPISRVHDTEW